MANDLCVSHGQFKCVKMETHFNTLLKERSERIMMKRTFTKIITMGAAAVLAGGALAACGGAASQPAATTTAEATTESTVTEPALETTTAQTTTETAAETTAAKTGSGKLVIYFDYSENMGDTSGMTADAITSASLVGETHAGVDKNNILVIADEISKQTGADVFSVRINETFDKDYNTMVRPEQDNQTQNRHYTFVEDIGDLSGYDTVFIGMPVWWSQLPQQMKVFIEEHDLSGKTIIPFGIHRGSGFGRMISQIQELQPSATVNENGYTVNATVANDTVRSEVDEWIRGLNL